MTPWTIAWQAPLSMEFSRQEHWSGDLPNSGIEPRSPALQGNSLPSESPGKPQCTGSQGSKFSDMGPMMNQPPLSHEEFQSIIATVTWVIPLVIIPEGTNKNLNFSPLHPKVKTSNTCERSSPRPELKRFSQCSLLKGRKQLSETLT